MKINNKNQAFQGYSWFIAKLNLILLEYFTNYGD